MTWPDAIAAFRTYLAGEEKSAHTVRNYTEDLEIFEAWYRASYQEDPQPGGLGATELREFKAHLSTARKLKPATVNRKLAAIRAFIRWAHKEGISPAVQAPKSIRQQTRPPRWLERKEELALLRAVERSACPRDRAVVTLMLHVGFRADELASLTWRKVTCTERKGQVEIMGKGRKERVVPLDAEARAALAGLRKLAGGHPGPDDRVVLGQRGGITPWTVHSIVTRYAELAKLPELTPHVLRHTWCKNLERNGGTLPQIAALAGHESLDTTRRYVEPGREELAQLVDRLSGED
jgi:site-specific recombinase XerD